MQPASARSRLALPRWHFADARVANRPAREIEVDAALVRALLREQHPDLSDLDITEVERGWDNTMFRLGNDLLARMPHRAVAAPLIELEQRWLPVLVERLPLAIPSPVRTGGPSDLFPWKWSIVAWQPGVELANASLKDQVTEARRLGDFMNALHVEAPADAPVNPWRGGSLADRRASFEDRLTMLPDEVDRELLRTGFEAGIQQSRPRTWLHGDIHARNIIIDRGQIAAIIDWGDVCAGDRATDLSIAFTFDDPNARSAFFEVTNATDADRARARGWAANFAAIYLTHADDDPVQRSIGTAVVAALAG